MNNEDGEISVGSRVPFPVSTFGLGGGAAPGGAAQIPGLGGLGELLPQRAARERRAGAEAHAPRQRARHDPPGGRRGDLASWRRASSNLGPSTSKRTAKTMVIGKDQQTVVIGGLMSDKVINSVTKVPLLGDIPILGFFFRSIDQEDREDEPHHRAHPLRHQRHVGSAARAREEDARAARVHRAVRRRRTARSAGADRLPPQARHAGGDQPRRARDRRRGRDELQRDPASASCRTSRGRSSCPRTGGGAALPPIGPARRGPHASGAAPPRRPAARKETRGGAPRNAWARCSLELKARTPGVDADARGARAGAGDPGAGGRAASARSWSRCAPSPRRTCCARWASSSGIAYAADLQAPTTSTPSLATAIPIGFAKQHRLLPVKREGDVGRWWRPPIRWTSARSTTCARCWQPRCSPVLVPSQQILEAINKVYGRKQDKGGELGEGEDEDDDGGEAEELVDILDAHRRGADHPLGQLAAVPRGQGARQRYPHRAGREGGHRSATASTACCTKPSARRTPVPCRRSSRA